MLHAACFSLSSTADTHRHANKTSAVCALRDLLTTPPRADRITHLFGIPATTTDAFAVLTTSQGLEQRLDADVKEA